MTPVRSPKQPSSPPRPHTQRLRVTERGDHLPHATRVAAGTLATSSPTLAVKPTPPAISSQKVSSATARGTRPVWSPWATGNAQSNRMSPISRSLRPQTLGLESAGRQVRTWQGCVSPRPHVPTWLTLPWPLCWVASPPYGSSRPCPRPLGSWPCVPRRALRQGGAPSGPRWPCHMAPGSGKGTCGSEAQGARNTHAQEPASQRFTTRPFISDCRAGHLARQARGEGMSRRGEGCAPGVLLTGTRSGRRTGRCGSCCAG